MPSRRGRHGDPGLERTRRSGKSRERETGGNPKRAARYARVGRPGTAPSTRIGPDPRRPSPARRVRIPPGAGIWRLVSGTRSGPASAGFRAFRGASCLRRSMRRQSLVLRLPVFRSCAGGDTKPTIAGVQSDLSNGAETAAVPGAKKDRAEADVNATMPKTQAVSTGAAPAPKPSQPGEPDLATSRPLEPISVGVRATVSASPRDTETPSQPNAGQPDAIDQLIEQLMDPAEAPRGPADGPASPVAHSPPRLRRPRTGQPETGEKPQAAPTDEAKATPSGPTETTPAASPSKAPVVEKRRESSARRDGSRQPVERRTAARRPPPVDGGQAPVSNATAPGRDPTTPILPGDMATAHSGRRRIRIEGD